MGYINSSNQLQWNILSNGSGVVAGTGPTITSNTWYQVTYVFQTGGTCYLYVNGTQYGAYTNVGGVGATTTSAFGIGTYDSSTSNAFNGYIDDFRIYNTALTASQFPGNQIISAPGPSIGAPNIYLPFENGSVLDVMLSLIHI